MNVKDRIKTALRTWLEIVPAFEKGAVRIDQAMTHDMAVLRNKVWFRGDPYELDQFFKQFNDVVGRSRFWAAAPQIPIRKIHVDLATVMIKRIAEIVASDFDGFEFTEPGSDEEQETRLEAAEKAIWEEIEKETRFQRLHKQAITDALVTGDGAFKVSMDTDITDKPIIEFFPADRVEFTYKRGRIIGTKFSTILYGSNGKRYRLEEEYGDGYIVPYLYKMGDAGESPAELGELPETEGLLPIQWDSGRLDIPLMFDGSTQYKGRGEPVLNTKSEAFDALDEVVSEWWDDYRKGRVKLFMPEEMFPRNLTTGEIIRPSEFDDLYVQTKAMLTEDGQLAIKPFTPDIRADKYIMGYMQAMDMCLQGIISPSTLGIDMKKMDNAEAQREKEKATMYTRSNIIDALNEALPMLVTASLQAYHMMHGTTMPELEISATFGEYASPSFDDTIVALVPAVQNKMMSVETMVDELWGDSKDKEWKKLEVERIKGMNSYSADLPDPLKMYEVADEDNAEQQDNRDDTSTVQGSLPNGWGRA